MLQRTKNMQVTCLSRIRARRRSAAVAAGLLAASFLAAACSSTAASPVSSGRASATSTVWLCLPGMTFPGLYTAQCEQSDGASWLNVTTGPAGHLPTVTEEDGPAWGYHVWDLSLAQDNLVSDVAAAETTWTRDHRLAAVFSGL
jgi:hypothetical protein